MPKQNGIWSDQATNLLEYPSPEDLAFDGEAASLVVFQQKALLAEPFFEYLIFGSQVLDDVLLVVMGPVLQTDQQQVPGLEDEIHCSPDAEFVGKTAASSIPEWLSIRIAYKLGFLLCLGLG
jgi:hypothetical protein